MEHILVGMLTDRPMGASVSVTFQHLLGDSFAPVLLAALMDEGRKSGLTQAQAMQQALEIVPIWLILAGVVAVLTRQCTLNKLDKFFQ